MVGPKRVLMATKGACVGFFSTVFLRTLGFSQDG